MTAITDRKIGVLMGGLSAEREVSLKTGGAVLNSLLKLGCSAVPIDAKEDLCGLLRRENIEIAFIALHGGAGEDGSVQGLLEVMRIPYTGSGVLASALAMDKEASKKMFCASGLRVPEFTVVRKGETPAVGFPLPWVVKPATEGSSIGVAMVNEMAKFGEALDAAFGFGSRAIVERRVLGKEIQVGVLGGRALGSVEVRPSFDFYSYEAKYTSGRTEYILPPEVDAGLLRRCEEAGLGAHMALGCRGATRVDLILDAEGTPYVLEVNTIPGMTETSLLPKIARLAGLEFPALVGEILRDALERQKG
jgi:D-alanine-D-alanine ligase